MYYVMYISSETHNSRYDQCYVAELTRSNSCYIYSLMCMLEVGVVHLSSHSVRRHASSGCPLVGPILQTRDHVTLGYHLRVKLPWVRLRLSGSKGGASETVLLSSATKSYNSRQYLQCVCVCVCALYHGEGLLNHRDIE